MLGFLRSRRVVKQPRLPEGIRIYAFGDIHGRSDLLKKMFTMIDADMDADLRDRKQLEHILAGVKRIPGVFDIERVYNV